MELIKRRAASTTDCLELLDPSQHTIPAIPALGKKKKMLPKFQDWVKLSLAYKQEMRSELVSPVAQCATNTVLYIWGNRHPMNWQHSNLLCNTYDSLQWKVPS
jgi:hypothetical protein